MKQWALIGYSGAMGDVIDAIASHADQLSEIILNIPIDKEKLDQDLAHFSHKIKISAWEDFSYTPEYCYQFGFFTPKKKPVISEIKKKCNIYFETLIHRTAVISPYATVAEGTLVGAQTVVSAFAKIGEHVRLNRMVSIAHHSQVGAYSHIAPGVTIAGRCIIGESTFIGAGSVLRDHIHVGNNVLIGAGSVVVKDIPDNMVVMGNPARIVRENI